MAAAAAIISGKVAFKADLADHVRALQAINRDLPSLFPAGSGVGETSALDAVWKNNDEFRKRAADAAKKSEALAQAVASGDAKAQAARLGELGDACKACHVDYRKPSM
jgi:cytochrome c556